jgi:hypothetical protein
MKNPKKLVEVFASNSVSAKLDRLKDTDKPRYDFIKKVLKDLKEEYPITDKVVLHPPNADGTRNFLADSGFNVTFAGWAEELPEKHIVHIEKLFF